MPTVRERSHRFKLWLVRAGPNSDGENVDVAAAERCGLGARGVVEVGLAVGKHDKHPADPVSCRPHSAGFGEDLVSHRGQPERCAGPAVRVIDPVDRGLEPGLVGRLIEVEVDLDTSGERDKPNPGGTLSDVEELGYFPNKIEHVGAEGPLGSARPLRLDRARAID